MRNEILFFIFLNQNICCGYSKESSQWDGSFENPKHMFKLMDKKKIAILSWKILHNWPYENNTDDEFDLDTGNSSLISVSESESGSEVGKIPSTGKKRLKGPKRTWLDQCRSSHMAKQSLHADMVMLIKILENLSTTRLFMKRFLSYTQYLIMHFVSLYQT